MLVWRGWGISVALFFLLWIVLGVGWAIGSGYHQPDAVRASLTIQWGLAAIVLLTALSVLAASLWRRAKVPPGHDEFMYLRLEFWPYILAVIALGVAVATWLGYQIFK
jgi:hypothetical protein